jgi:hypothetical protein
MRRGLSPAVVAGGALAILVLLGIGLGAAFQVGPWSRKPAIDAIGDASPSPTSTPVVTPSPTPTDTPAAVSADRAASATPPPAPTPATPPSSPSSAATAVRSATPPANAAAGSSTPPVTAPPTPAVTPAAGQTPAAAAPSPARPENPPILFQCSGAPEICPALRSAVDQALSKDSLPNVRDAARAEIVINARVTLVDQRSQEQFGTTFVVKTYAIELDGEARASSEAVPMPAQSTLSFDARVGRERLDEHARVVAAGMVEKIRQYWKKRSPTAF